MDVSNQSSFPAPDTEGAAYCGKNAYKSVLTKEENVTNTKVAKKKNKYKLLPPCNENCRQQCSQNLSPNIRNLIFDHFQSLNFGERRLFFDGHISFQEVNRRKLQEIQNIKRITTFIYTMPNDDKGGTIQVCKTMFLSTLRFKTDARICEFAYAKQEIVGLTDTFNKRGRHSFLSKDEGRIIQHINSYYPQAPYFQAVNSPNRRYLESKLNLQMLYDDYNAKYKEFPVCHETYRMLFKKETIGFYRLKEDVCSVCEENTASVQFRRTANQCFMQITQFG